MKRKQNFTLIELLVVVAIIAILAAILLPALGRARDTARKSVCTSNVKQCMLAYRMYVDDHAGWGAAPYYNANNPMNVPSNDTPGELLWSKVLYYMGYQKNRPAFTCPGLPSAYTHPNWWETYGIYAAWSDRVRTWMNKDLASLDKYAGGGYREIAYDALSTWPETSDTPAMTPSKANFMSDSWTKKGTDQKNMMSAYITRGGGNAHRIGLFHGGTESTVGWMDGHVTQVKMEDLRNRNQVGAAVEYFWRLDIETPIDSSIIAKKK